MSLAVAVSWLLWGSLVLALGLAVPSAVLRWRGGAPPGAGGARISVVRVTFGLLCAVSLGAWALAPGFGAWPLAACAWLGAGVWLVLCFAPAPREGAGARLRAAGDFAAVVAVCAAATLALPGVADRQFAFLGLAAGLALPALVAGIYEVEAAAGSGAALAAHGAVLAGAAIWGDRLRPESLVGAGGAIGFAGLVAMLLAVGGIWARGARSSLAAGILAAAAAYPLLALALRQPQMAVPAAIGAGMGALLALFATAAGEEDAEPPPVVSLAALAVGGGTLLLINRLYGMPGLGLAGIGLVVAGAADLRATRWLATLLPAIFGGRALLQLYLGKTYLRLEGVDVTQTYAFAALILGFALATALARFRKGLAPGHFSGALLAFLVACSPILVGYLIHLLPLAAFLAGLLAASFALVAVADGLEAGASRLAPYLVLSCAAAAAGGPFLTTLINAPRSQRISVFLVVSAVVLCYALLALRSQPRQPAAA